jgi:hypothetical protein
VRVRVHHLLLILPPFFNRQHHVALAELSGRQHEDLAQAAAGLGRPAYKELVAVGASRHGTPPSPPGSGIRDPLFFSDQPRLAGRCDGCRDLADDGGTPRHLRGYQSEALG